MSMTTAEGGRLREEFLRLLREDEEFRYAVAGYLGFSEILKRLEEHDKKFNVVVEELKAINKRLEEHSKKLEEHDKKFNEILARLEEHSKRLEEHDKKFVEVLERLDRHEEELKKLREDFNRAFESFSRRLDALGARWGILSEKAFREAMIGVVQKILGVANISRWVYYDASGEVYGVPSTVEVDVVIKDDLHILVEIKSSVSKGDVVELAKIAKLYETIYKVKTKAAIVSPYVSSDATQLAKSLGIEVYTAS